MKKHLIFLIFLFAGFTTKAQETKREQVPYKELTQIQTEQKSTTSSDKSSRNVIFSEDFETPAGNGFAADWTNIPTPGGDAWSREPYWFADLIQEMMIPGTGSAGRYAIILDDSNIPHDAWLITQGIPLVQGQTYQISFLLTFESGNGHEKLEMKIGKSETVADMTNLLFTSDDIAASSFQCMKISVNYTPDADDQYYVGWHALSQPGGHFIMIDDVSVTEVASNENNLQNITTYLYSQVPVSQTLPSGKVKNIGEIEQTNVTLTVTINGTTVGASSPLASLAVDATAELQLNPPVYVPEGQNTMIYTITQDQEDSYPNNNICTFNYKGTQNVLAIDEKVNCQIESWPVISSTITAYGHIFNINQPVTLSQVLIGFGHSMPLNYSISLYKMESDLTTAATPIFTQTAEKDPVVGFSCVDVPATLLTPDNYYLCINKPLGEEMGVVFDGNAAKKTYGRDDNGNLSGLWEYGAAAIRLIMETDNCMEPFDLAVVPDYYSATFSWDGDAAVYELIFDDGDKSYSFFTQNKSMTIEGMLINTPYTWSVKAVCDANHNATVEGPSFSTLACEAITDFPWEEDFENPSSFPPPCWTVHNVEGGDRTWARNNNATFAHSGNNSVWHISNTGVYQEGLLVTPQFELTDSGIYLLEFWSYNDWAEYNKYSGIWISTTDTDPSSFTEIKQLAGSSEVSASWKKITLSLHDYAGEKIYIAFKYTGIDGDEWYIDDVKLWNITGESTVTVQANPSEGGVVTGGGTYQNGLFATVTATANANYSFVNWKKGNEIVSTDTLYTFIVIENVTLVANFEENAGICGMKYPADFIVYPNPATNMLKVARSTNDKVQIEIYNSIGALLQSFETSETETEINVSGLSSGIYLIRLIDRNEINSVSIRKFIKE